MPSPLIKPTRHTDPTTALAQVKAIYDQQIAHLRRAMQRYVAGDTPPGHVRACYPFVRIHTDTVARATLQTPDIDQLSYGFVAGPGRGKNGGVCFSHGDRRQGLRAPRAPGP